MAAPAAAFCVRTALKRAAPAGGNQRGAAGTAPDETGKEGFCVWRVFGRTFRGTGGRAFTAQIQPFLDCTEEFFRDQRNVRGGNHLNILSPIEAVGGM